MTPHPPRPVPRRALRAAACAGLVAIAACSAEPPPPPPDSGPSISGTTVRFPRRVEGIRTEPVQDAGTTTLTLPGRLAWDEDRTVRVLPPFAGRVTALRAQVGDAVRAGQPLAEIAAPEFGQAVADGRRAEADEALARETVSRQRELHDAGLVAAKDLREAQAVLSRAEIERQRTRARLAQLGAAGGGATFTLRAPIDGVVVERALAAGQEVRPDADKPLFVVTDPTRLWVWLDAPENALPQLAPMRAGAPLKLHSGAWGTRDFDAKLVRTEDSIDAISRTFRLRAAVANPERLLKAEMYVTATFPLPPGASDRPIEHVPVTAVLLVDGRRHVFVADPDGGFTRVEVGIVRELPGRVGVVGLEPGQRVVVEGNLFLQQILARGTTPKSARAEAKK
ncbi:MAG: efflux RND transporter periplasmic adaptor subunit [Burkholderiaceae bacterium]|jgi:cobalt-zinc-cadmium efflux system membrane fusion protein|nr:efflux RND transporter periplasmic adaptor subunit [Burkholderiales bacterium]MCZ8107387.1 efflux RND transporter periplasmic adaptor subunit [Burkholderiales bacterium]MCZ8339243.1 efflux RND transporter periplasmic adaptor subunit [Burkholderiaceae bacterium]